MPRRLNSAEDLLWRRGFVVVQRICCGAASAARIGRAGERLAWMKRCSDEGGTFNLVATGLSSRMAQAIAANDRESVLDALESVFGEREQV
jgi:hypothetical protein